MSQGPGPNGALRPNGEEAYKKLNVLVVRREREGIWPTPNARDWKDTGATQGRRHSPNLGTAVHQAPPPR